MRCAIVGAVLPIDEPHIRVLREHRTTIDAPKLADVVEARCQIVEVVVVGGTSDNDKRRGCLHRYGEKRKAMDEGTRSETRQKELGQRLTIQ